MNKIDDYFTDRLNKRKADDKLRELSDKHPAIDFCSNDYLGLARSAELRKKIERELNEHPDLPIGATGSRLVTGNTTYAEHLENEIALFHHAEAGLLFNSGYTANLGLFSSILQRNDTVICDELIHACIHDGIRLSFANKLTFKHNDLNHLEEKLKNVSGNIFIAVESLYSMDGDIAPLTEMVKMSKKYNAHLIVDEAHATGVYGKNGRGLVALHGLEEDVFARVYTFGKALGSHGAIVVGSEKLKNYLINFARPFIYTTALPFHNLAHIKCAYEMLIMYPNLQQKLFANIKRYLKETQNPGGTVSPVQSKIIVGNKAAKQAATNINAAGLDVRAILSPTVPVGAERLRLCLHSYNTEEEIDKLAGLLNGL